MTLKKRTTLLFFLIIGSFFILSSDISAESTAVIKVEPLNVRGGPGLSHEQVTQVHKGESYPVIQQKGNWVQIQMDSRKGWVAKWLVDLKGTPTVGKVTSDVDRLRIRSGPGTAHDILGHMNKGTSYSKSGEQGEWIRIDYDGKQGWVHQNYVNVTTAASSSSDQQQAEEKMVQVNNLNVRKRPSLSSEVIDQLDKGTKVTVTSERENWSNVTYNNNQGWVASQFIEKSTPASTQEDDTNPSTEQSKGTVTVQTPILNVRSEGNLGSQVIAQVKKGDKLPFLQEKEAWYQIKLDNGQTGWVANWLVERDSVSTSNSKEWITLLYNATNIRKGPGTDTAIVGRASMGDQFVVKSHKNKWYEIEYNNKTAYVADWIVANSQTDIKQMSQKNQTLKNKTIVIDAGHGGRDVGTIGHDGFYEKKLTIKTANRLAERLRLAGANVILTRTDDTYISLSSRATMSNVKGADAFLSLHYNSFPQSPSVSGIGTYYYHDRDRAFAQTVQRAMIQSTALHNREARFGDYHVIRENRQPALLLELGFLSNPQEGKTVQTKSFQEKITKGIAKGVIEYLNK
ncbi:SH3 domain-containing protein [Pontibacillus sp. HMF3514]|uniref:SH3 domain-containing protein n=1 Tax=Pontibacillus sp. HMF3514 TaxID=2692425 RepID=UPI00131F711E|nr:SH3 domain-containing protein [Pontibacillus sp. HMF3514]QHE53099.1 SH3 domain-containing protein [Pontibacillus sp. HMF3514]